jgi:hypothetical protein
MAAALALAGCAQGSANDPNLSPEQQRLRQLSDKKWEWAGYGALAGAVAGGVIGAVADRGRGRGIAIGAGVGALLGGGAGYLAAHTNESYANSEDELRKKTETARAEAQDFRAIASESNKVAAQHRSRIAVLQRELRAGRVTNDQARAEARVMRDDLSRMETAHEENEKIVRAIDTDIAKLRAQRRNTAELQRERAAIASSGDSLRGSIDDLQRGLAGMPA